MKLRYLLPFFLIFNAQAQFKIETNVNELDLKSKYVDVSARDTFGLKNLVSTKGIVRIKKGDNSIYFNRNGLSNHSYGASINLDILEGYYNNSQQNNREESSNSQNSAIGQINTQTVLLKKDLSHDVGLKLKYLDYYLGYEEAKSIDKIDGETLIEINDEKELVKYLFNFDKSSKVYGLGFKYGFAKFVVNAQDSNKFNNRLINASYNGLNIYSDLKEISGLLNVNLGLFNKKMSKININIVYDKSLDLNICSNDYSNLMKRDFERKLENRLRIVPRIYDSGLETKRDYLEDMFFTDKYNFYLSKGEIKANINLDYLLAHYSKESKKVGLKYKFALLTYDFKNHEFKFGLFLN